MGLKSALARVVVASSGRRAVGVPLAYVAGSVNMMRLPSSVVAAVALVSPGLFVTLASVLKKPGMRVPAPPKQTLRPSAPAMALSSAGHSLNATFGSAGVVGGVGPKLQAWGAT